MFRAFLVGEVSARVNLEDAAKGQQGSLLATLYERVPACAERATRAQQTRSIV